MSPNRLKLQKADIFSFLQSGRGKCTAAPLGVWVSVLEIFIPLHHPLRSFGRKSSDIRVRKQRVPIRAVEICSTRSPENLLRWKVWMGVRGVREEDLSVNTLPSPAQLMGRRRKGGGGRGQSGDASQRQAAAVTQHIGDLRMKQSAIEQMKKEKWWGSTLGYPSENGVSFDVGNLISPETPWSLDGFHTQPQFTAPSPTHLNGVPVTPQAFGGCTEQVMDLAPGRNPMMSFVVTGTAHREIERRWDTPCLNASCVDTPYLDTPCLSRTDFWGFPSII